MEEPSLLRRILRYLLPSLLYIGIRAAMAWWSVAVLVRGPAGPGVFLSLHPGLPTKHRLISCGKGPGDFFSSPRLAL